MAARALASVTVSFGMVSIPVKLYAATQAQAGISFNLLHGGGCGSRLKQQYLCAREGVVVERADMVKGYEFAKDQYVTFTPEELKELEEKGTQTIEINEFVPADSIDPIYYDKAYFLGPDKGGAKPYALLAESMRQTGQTAVGRYAARGKQYIVQLRAVPGGLVMQQLLYAPEVRSIEEVGVETAPVRDSELSLAKQLIGQISSKSFDPTQYEDDVRKRIEAAVQKKVEGEEIAISPSARGRRRAGHRPDGRAARQPGKDHRKAGAGQGRRSGGRSRSRKGCATQTAEEDCPRAGNTTQGRQRLALPLPPPPGARATRCAKSASCSGCRARSSARWSTPVSLRRRAAAGANTGSASPISCCCAPRRDFPRRGFRRRASCARCGVCGRACPRRRRSRGCGSRRSATRWS